MPQQSILGFLEKQRPSRPEHRRPGQPYHIRSCGNPNNRGPNRRRNADLKLVADETKAELPTILSSLKGFGAARSSVHDLTDLDMLDPKDCPGFVLAGNDADAGKKGTRIRVFDMDTFDAALQLDPNYKAHTHLNRTTTLTTPTSPKEPASEQSVEDRRVEVERLSLDHARPSSSKTMDETISKPADQHASANKPVAVLNLASERSPGGGWQNGALAQEECLCYRSSLHLSLHRSYYPLPSLSAIYTPSVLLIRDAMSRGHALLTPQVKPADLPVVSVISVAALRKPELTDDKKQFRNAGQRAETKRKIRVTLRVAASKGHTKIVLGALGCGVFANPPEEVAGCFLEVLREKEFQGGWWEEVVFAVLDNVKGERGGKDGDGNFGMFYGVLDGEIV